MPNMMNIICMCDKECYKSSLSQRHAAVVLFRSKIMAMAHNYYRSTGSKSIHAEVAVIQKFLKRYPKKMLEKCSLYVFKINRMDEICNSTPCDNCARYIMKHKIPNVIFTLGEAEDQWGISPNSFTFNTYHTIHSLLAC